MAGTPVRDTDMLVPTPNQTEAVREFHQLSYKRSSSSSATIARTPVRTSGLGAPSTSR